MAREEASYFTRDNLKNYLVRVELRKLTGSGLAANQLRDTGRLTASRASTIAGQDTQSWIFRWQEKVFSQHEEELYADGNNCVTALQDKYHRDILTLRNDGGRPNDRLFSYVDSDLFQLPIEEFGRQMIDSGQQTPPTFVSRHESSVRRRHIIRKNQSLPSSVIRDPVSDRPSVEERISHRIITPPSQSMYIMADLRKKDGRDESDEHVLCHITVDAHGVVTVDPDFNVGKPSYRIENRHRVVFEYRLEHISEEISQEEKMKEKRVLSELCSRHASYLNACVASTFSDPPEGDTLGVSLLGEIVSAKGFEYDDLYVTAHLELPEFWQLSEGKEDDQCLSVVTQICRTKSKHLYNIAYFSCPFEYEMEYSNPTEQPESLPKMPRVLLEVSSLDYWDRHRVEGYGYMDIPDRPGSYDITVHTWRPSGHRVVDKMRRFFVGGAPRIDDVSYIATPRDFQGTHLSKIGFRTETTGSVRLRLNMLHQSRLLVKGESSDHLLKYKGLKATVAAALDAFQRARHRAAAVSASVQ